MTTNKEPESECAKDFFLARQPILNREQELSAYELLFRSGAAGPANVTDDRAATASVIEHASDLGLVNVIGASQGFVNIDERVLMSDFVKFLPREKIFLEILETVEVTDAVVARVEQLVAEGFRFVLDDVIADSPGLRRLLPYVEIIKIDIMGMKQSRLSELFQIFKASNKKMLAEKVETLDDFKFCHDLGFDFFQGYYFAKPVIISGKKISSSQLKIVRLINMLATDAETTEIEAIIKQEASLGLNLMRLVNTPAFTRAQKISSLKQALTMLGQRQLQRWLQILMYAGAGKADGLMSPLLNLATTRGKLLELMAQKSIPRNQMAADTAFTVGIMSLLDTLFGTSMEKILDQISVADEVKQALLHRNGIYGEMLQLAMHVENLTLPGPLLAASLSRLDLSMDELRTMQIEAFGWSDDITLSGD
jgi:EAL and modified HD-GYP domain-containing signal transduction protein